MSISETRNTTSTSLIKNGDCLNVKLSLSLNSDTKSRPVDAVLILDRSSSMTGCPLTNLKRHARKVVEIISEDTDNSNNCHERSRNRNENRIGVVSFAHRATIDAEFTASTEEIYEAIDSLNARNFSNHEDAFSKALSLFECNSSNRKILVIFTDGITTPGYDNANELTKRAKKMGITIYSIGITGGRGYNKRALLNWSSDPNHLYTAINPDEDDLERLFENITDYSYDMEATNIVLRKTLSSCFRITSFSEPSEGHANLINPNLIEWRIDKLSENHINEAELNFEAIYTGYESDTIDSEKTIDYEDDENNCATFYAPEINADYSIIVSRNKNN